MLIDIGHYLEINKILVSLFLGGRFIEDCYCLLLKIYSFYFSTMNTYDNLCNKNHKFLLNIDTQKRKQINHNSTT